MVIKEQRICYSRDDSNINNERNDFYDYTTVAARVKTHKELGMNLIHESPRCAILQEVNEDFEIIIIVSKIADVIE